MLYNDIGVDLGTANTLVFKKGKGIVVREPSVVAMNIQTGQVVKVGNEAREMIGRTPNNIIASRPLKGGVIADYKITSEMLYAFMRKAIGMPLFSKTRVLICVPSGVTAVERRAVEEAAIHSGAKEAYLIEEPLAAAIGAGLPVSDAIGSMIVDIGGGTTEIAVISLSGIVSSCSVRVGGDRFDEVISAYIKRRHNVIIGERTAEEIKLQIGSAFPLNVERNITVRGRDIVTGLPSNIVITSEEVREALTEPLSAIVEAVKSTLEITPPELSADIISSGIKVSGGGALLSGIDTLIELSTGIKTFVADNPLDCVVMGTGKALDNIALYRTK